MIISHENRLFKWLFREKRFLRYPEGKTPSSPLVPVAFGAEGLLALDSQYLMNVTPVTDTSVLARRAIHVTGRAAPLRGGGRGGGRRGRRARL